MRTSDADSFPRGRGGPPALPDERVAQLPSGRKIAAGGDNERDTTSLSLHGA